ncbi:hypothetical protein C0Q16_22265, partial [Klebsiella pneumoniae]
KTFMVREGLFDDVDAALTWHPEAWAGMFSTRTLCASTVVPARKAVREKPLWCAKGCLMMSMRR